MMPTRLGNMLRRYEILAGAPYELDAPTVLPSLALVAPPGHLDYLNDQRSALHLGRAYEHYLRDRLPCHLDVLVA